MAPLDILRLTPYEDAAFIRRLLERQVALYLVLPLRELFIKHVKKNWEAAGLNFSTDQTDLIYVQQCPKVFGGKNYFILPGGEAAACNILRIGSQLVPRSDVVRRKAEASWMEALFMCMSCNLGGIPDYGPPIADGLDGNLKDPSQLRGHRDWTANKALLQTYADIGHEPSTGFWRLFCNKFVLGLLSNKSVNLIAMALELNIHVMSAPPGKDPANAPQDMLIRFCNAIIKPADGNDRIAHITGLLGDADHNTLLDDVLPRILEEMGKTRQLKLFFEYWKDVMLNTFYDRRRMDVIGKDEKRAFTWDHPRLLAAFRKTFQKYGNAEMAGEWFPNRTFLQAVLRLSDVRNDDNPTEQDSKDCYYTLAGVTILTEIIKAAKKVPPGMTLHNLYTAAVEGAQAIGFWQMERWRFMALAEELIKISQPGNNQHLEQSGVGWIADRKTLQPYGPENQLWMEKYYFASYMLAAYSARPPNSEAIINGTLTTLSVSLEKYLTEGEPAKEDDWEDEDSDECSDEGAGVPVSAYLGPENHFASKQWDG
ncbi:hypothetical protein LTR66_016786, partial [Elasticomyces elasticus]